MIGFAEPTRKDMRGVKLISPPPSQKHDSQAVSYTTLWATIRATNSG